MKELVWQGVLAQTSFDSEFHIIDSLPLPACRFARAYRCRRFKGDASFGHDSLARQTFYGFRLHALVAWPGVIVGFSVASANIHETAIAPELASGRFGTVLGVGVGAFRHHSTRVEQNHTVCDNRNGPTLGRYEQRPSFTSIGQTAPHGRIRSWIQ